MNTFKIFMACAALALSCAEADADTAQGTEMTEINMRPTNRNNRPKSPSMQQISCLYDGESLHVTFLVAEGYCTVTVVAPESGTESYAFDSEAPAVIEIGALTSATITINTESGNTYQGEI